MIQANELRIGNFVQSIPQNKTYRVKITTLRRILDGKHFVFPIELNEMWLTNFGFRYDKTWNRFTIFENDAFSIYSSFDNDNGFQIWFENAFAESTININYVHQLQNLFHSLTGKELNYNIYGMPLMVFSDVI